MADAAEGDGGGGDDVFRAAAGPAAVSIPDGSEPVKGYANLPERVRVNIDKQKLKMEAADDYRRVCASIVQMYRQKTPEDTLWMEIFSGRQHLTQVTFRELFPDNADAWEGRIDQKILRDVVGCFQMAAATYPNEYLAVSRPSLECFNGMYEALIASATPDMYNVAYLPFLLDKKGVREKDE